MFIQVLLIFIFIFSIFYSFYESNLFKKIIFLNFSLTGLIILFVFHTFFFNSKDRMLFPFVNKTLNQNSYVSDPLPQALMLTAIVVGLATTSIFLSIIMKIKKYFGTIDQVEIDQIIVSIENAKK